MVAQMPPPRVAPRIVAVFTPSRSIEFAGCSCAAGTVSGVSAEAAGKLTAVTAPLTALSAASRAMLAVPVRTVAATTAWVRAPANDEPTRTSPRGRRSATTPPISSSATLVMDLLATTRPRAAAPPPMSRTAKASATGAMALPNSATLRAASRNRNGQWPRGLDAVIKQGPGRRGRPRRGRAHVVSGRAGRRANREETAGARRRGR